MGKNKQIINNFLKKIIFKNKQERNYLTKNIFTTDKVDSFTFLEVIIKIEDKFKIKLKDKDILSTKMNNIENLTKLILKYLNEKK
ncbi:MAG: hypothetical protein CBC25_04820 [Pelagibacteraceae bacterium TMED65]|nr:MAG: hypothetical protein CBC25_04820 [Pelagibacteraceae bacterium TMED65]|tara:strand:+ start:4600 stop:4854 length:255 start_codon:yes stop_codon:yes gene_type:complete